MIPYKTKTTLVYLVIVVLALAISGCSVISSLSLPGRDNGRIPGDSGENGYLSIYDLVQKLADSIRNENEIENIFSSIPSRQKDGLTLDQYQQYIRLLKRGITGDITSFSLMSEKEIAEQRDLMLVNLAEKEDLILSMQGAWLYYREVGRAETRFPVFVAEHTEGFNTLSKQWVQDILALYDLARLYFDAIDRSDPAALAVLIRSDDRPADILIKKAGRIIDFYHNNISSRTTEFFVTKARIDSLGFEQFGITNPDQTQSVSRNIEFIARSGQGYTINDVIPDIINLQDLDIYFNQQLIIQFAALEDDEPVIVRSNTLESIIGEPLVHDETNCVNIAGGNQRMTLEYENLELMAEGSCFRHSRWEGQVKNLVLLDNWSALGSGISPGDSIYDILRQYPFADKTGFVIYRRVDAGIVRLQFFVENEMVQSVELKLSAS